MLTGGRQLARSTLTAAQVAQDALVAPEGVSDPCASALIDWPTFWATEGPQADFLCEPFLARGRGHAMYATAKLGKSLILLEAAAALATGASCWLHESTEPTDVVYLDLEMTAEDVKERLSDFGYDETSDLSRLHYYLLPHLPPLDTEAGGLALEAIVKLRSPTLVVIDTMSRVVHGDENEASTYQGFYRHTGLRLKRLGVTYIRLDHAGKDMTKGQRGSSAKADDVDVVWQASRNGTGFRFKATHRRMGWVPETVDVNRELEPLRHVPLVTSIPADVSLTASRLDQLGAPLDITQRDAKKMLQDAGWGKATEHVSRAINHRLEIVQRRGFEGQFM
jgi:RecA-family ATPase